MNIDFIARADRIVLVGYGAEGKSSHAFLKKRFPQGQFRILENIETPLKEGKLDEIFVISPGIDRQKFCTDIPPEKQTSNTEIFFSNISEKQRAKIIGISGSKGKSTTTKFCADFLNEAGYETKIGGNFGIPLLDLFDQLSDVSFIVAELSSFQLEALQISPKYAIFLNLFTDHIDRHGGLTKYGRAKANLWNGTKKSADFLIVPRKHVPKVPENTLSDQELITSETLSIDLIPNNSILQAEHFRENIGTIKSLAHILQIHNCEESLKTTAQNFEALEHRIEKFTENGGHTFYDDSISTNPETSIAAINFFGERLGAIILGGQSGGNESFQSALHTLRNRSPHAFIWLPESENHSQIMADATQIHFPAEKIVQGKDFSELLKKGLTQTKSNSVILLSPGSKSFDTFKNYKQRGIAWKNAVQNFFK